MTTKRFLPLVALLLAALPDSPRAATVIARATATAVVCVVVAPVAAAGDGSTSGDVRFRQVTKLADGFHVQMSAADGQRFTIQASSNLVDWATVTTLSATNGLLRFVDADVAEPQRFYRAQRAP